MGDVEVKELIELGKTQSQRLRDELRTASDSFDAVKATAQALLDEGVALLDDQTRESLMSFDERISALFVETTRFSAFFKTTYAKPVMPTPIQRIDPESDQALIVRELLAAAKQLSDSTEVIAKNSAGAEREHYINEMVRASQVVMKLLDPLLMIERGESN